jgi:ABC-2 type transport system permease protein
MATNVSTLTQSRPAGAALKRFALLVQANFVMYFRNRAAMFWAVLFPIGLMLVLGAMYGNQQIDPSVPGSLTAISFLVPGLIVLSFMSSGLVGNSTAMAYLRENGILRRVQATPLPVAHLILSRVVMQSTMAIGQAALMLATSIVVFNARYDVAGLLMAVPFIILGAILFMAMGQAIAALARKAETVQVVAQVVNFPLMFLGTLWIPTSAMPDWLQTVSKVLPSTLVVNLVRTPMLSGLSISIQPSVPLAICFVGVVAYLVGSVVISARYFKWS